MIPVPLPQKISGAAFRYPGEGDGLLPPLDQATHR
jgi:hypothetical protein